MKSTLFAPLSRLLFPAFLLLACGFSPAAAPAQAEFFPRSDQDQARQYFTDLPLITQEGRHVKFFSDLLADNIVIISGFYTDCTTVCPKQNFTLFKLQKRIGDLLGSKVFFVSITIDPKNDTPEVVSEYSKRFSPQPGWTFLSGKPENIDWVNYKLGQYTENVLSHRGLFLVGNLQTGLWKKISPSASEEDLEEQIEDLLD